MLLERTKRQRESRLRSCIVLGAAGIAWFVAATLPSGARSAELPTLHKRMRLVTGTSATVTVRVPNTGSVSWERRGGARAVLHAEKAASALRHPFWPSARTAARLEERSVAPGETGTFRMAVRVPDVPGTVEEFFAVDAPAGTVTRVLLTVEVVPKPPPLRAAFSSQAQRSLTVLQASEFTVEVELQNTGSSAWRRHGRQAFGLVVAEPETRTSVFRHRFWKNARKAAALRQEKVQPGESVTLRFALAAPKTAGTYTETFQLTAGTLSVENGRLQLTIIVTDPPPVPTPATQQADEPMLDVGLFSTADPLVVTSDAAMTVIANETAIGTVEPNATATLTYADGWYGIVSPSVTGQSETTAYRLVAEGGRALTLVNYEHRPAWNAALNDNAFRGSIELRHATSTTWVINRLPLEQYLRGLAEAGNDAPAEYLKALITAARSYAHYHIRTNTKHKTDGFTVDAAYDQVYRGYNFELRTPHLTAAVEATKGVEVTYGGEPVLTPYFSNTDGRTRAWEEVWAGGPYPWLTSVPDPASEGLELLGHGVGMSALGALTMAQEGKMFEEILAYYYTGTSVAKQY